MRLYAQLCAPTHTKTSHIVVLLTTASLLCSLILFVFVNEESSRDILGLIFKLPSESKINQEDLGIELHPIDHVTRPATQLSYQWNITKGYRYPDGVKKLVYLINNEYPGPTVEARSGDKIAIDVINCLEDVEGVAIHFHGMLMRGANNMDGVVGVTQEAILPGTTFTYSFDISSNQSGTFWYHSHSDLQRADGLYGGLIVHKPVNDGKSESNLYGYSTEKLLLVGDWYHREANVVQGTYVNPDSFGLEPAPDSVVVNGRGSFNCSMAVPARPVECMNILSPALIVAAGERIRLRVVNVGAMTGITMNLPHSHTNAIQVDGGSDLQAGDLSQEFGVLYPGERVDLVAYWPSTDIDVHMLSITLDRENFKRKNLALTPTHFYPIKLLRGRQRRALPPLDTNSDIPTLNYFNLSTAQGVTLNELLPTNPSETIVVYTKIELLQKNVNVPMGYLNRTTWKPQSPPLLKIPRTEWDNNQLVPFVPLEKEGEEVKWVDIVVNNIDEKGHPFHLHGYNFYVLATYKFPRRGVQFYNPSETSKHPAQVDPNLVNPVMKDTVYIPAMGYVVLRIRADNPGIWLFHCHILWHSGTGMAMAIEIGSV